MGLVASFASGTDERSDQSPQSQAQQPYSGGLRDDPGHELATGGLYDSARKDRQPFPTPWPGTAKENYAGADVGGHGLEGAEDDARLPRGSYPVHEDPAASQQHPQEAFRNPVEVAAGAPQRGTPPADRAVEGDVPPSSQAQARPDMHGVTRDTPPQDVQRGKVGVTKAPSEEEVHKAQKSFAAHSVGQGLEEPTRGKLDEGADWAQTDRH